MSQPVSKKVPENIQKMIDMYAAVGMEITMAANLGRPQSVRRSLKLASNDFAVTAFMASQPSRHTIFRDVARTVPQILNKLNHQYDLKMPLVSGGGNWEGEAPTDKTGIMGHWAYGATRDQQFSRFIITQGLIEREGMPLSPGTTLCLYQTEGIGDTRLGSRTDGLIYASNLLLGLPGGLGTLLEFFHGFANITINAESSINKFLVVDPVVRDVDTNSLTTCWENDRRSLKQKNHDGTISDRAALTINDSSVMYRPPAGITAERMSQDIASLTLAIRADAHNINPSAGFTPVPPRILREHIMALTPGAEVVDIFNNQPKAQRTWGTTLNQLIAHASLTNG